MKAHRIHALTPEALLMMDAIARSGSFAAAARELGKVPSALTYSVRQLEEALDVLLFDRRSGQAQLTAAGCELVHEGRRLLQEMDAVSNRVHRVASGWETQLAISLDDIVALPTVFELVQDFCALGTATRLRLRTEVLAGTLETLVTGQVDLAVGVSAQPTVPAGLEMQPLGEVEFLFCVAPHHPLATAAEPVSDAERVNHRAVAVADTATRLAPLTVNLLPGQDVLTLPTMQSKLEALLRGLGSGWLPEPMARVHLDTGRLVAKATGRGRFVATLHYAWRAESGPLVQGRALQWWLERLQSPVTRRALLHQHAAGPQG